MKTDNKIIFRFDRKKGIFPFLYKTIFIVFCIIGLFASYVFTTINNVIPNLIGFILAPALILKCLLILGLEEVLFYEKFIIANYKFFKIKHNYDDIKYFWNSKTLFTNDIAIKNKYFFKNIFISKYLFNITNLDKFELFLNNKNIKRHYFKIF